MTYEYFVGMIALTLVAYFGVRLQLSYDQALSEKNHQDSRKRLSLLTHIRQSYGGDGGKTYSIFTNAANPISGLAAQPFKKSRLT